jgi:imidazolonepropionase-like amidohydrolase
MWTCPFEVSDMRSIACTAILVGLSVAAPCYAAEDSWLIPAQKIYTAPDAPALLHGNVLVRNGRIAAVADERSRIAIPEGTPTSDCRGVVAAGFQNSHVHFMERKYYDAAHAPARALERDVRQMSSRYGFTTVFDTASDEENTVALRARIESGELLGPRIRTVGWGIFPPHGIPFYLDDLPERFHARLPQPKDARETRAVVRANLAGGADATKIFMVTAPKPGSLVVLPPEVARAAAEETHAAGKLLLAHPTSLAGLREGLDAGVDIFVHTTLGEKNPWDAPLIRRMVSRHVSVIPTFKLWYYELAKQQVPAEVADPLVAATFDELRAFKAGGGQILFGTDVGYMHDYDPTDEYLLMAKAGLTPMEILASLTTAPADRWKESTIHGRVQPGYAADLVVLEGDPAEDVKNFAQVRCAFRAGKLIYASDES